MTGHELVYTYKYPVECLWVMCCGQNGSVLHMSLEIPKLFQTNITDIHNVVTL